MSRKTRTRLLLLATLVTLAFVPAAAPANTPLITLGPITVLNGTALVSGSIGSEVSGAKLSVNGHPLGIKTSGAFAGVVDLNGADTIVLALSRPATGIAIQLRIPLLGRTVIPGSVLDSLVRAGISILQPVAKPGQPILVNGSVGDDSQLVGLTVNGVDVMSLLQGGGTFSVPLPGDAGQVQVNASFPNGTTETIETPVFRPFSTATVSAGRALGIRIVRIRYVRKGALRTHRIRMIVTVRDRQGRLIRGATIRVAAKGHKLAKRPRTTRSGRKGRATVFLRLRPSAYGKRIVTVTLAKTPRATARKTSAVRVPAKH